MKTENSYKPQALSFKKKFLRTDFIAAFLVIVGAFALSGYAFTSPPAGCTPGSCASPLTVDFTNQTVSVAQAPTASGQVATKGYVDNAVTSSVVSNSMPRMITAETAGTYTLGQAMRYCENLSATCQKEWSPGVSGTTNLTWTDNCSTTYSDWRLPTVGELLQFSNSNYGFNSGITDDSYLWTATPYDSNNNNWVSLRLSDATGSYDGYNNNNYVRCVR